MPDIVKERPILFSAPMVRAILDGSKAQTRRIAKGVIARHARTGEALSELDSAGPRVSCPYGRPGDRLWVRETFVQGFDQDPVTGVPMWVDSEGNDLPKKTWYRASDQIGWCDDDGWETNVPWKPSIHMPRAASRMDLLIKSVRVERLQDISEADALAEGITYDQLPDNPHDLQRAQTWYRGLWEQINGAGSWEANPWVWVIDFERIKP
jgi:hypothetical protein